MDSAPAPLDPRLRRALELVYQVDGVSAARIWSWPGKIAIGVRGSGSPADLLHRVEAATLPLREPDEAWEFGLLEDP
jgi:hypothetical protein